MSIFPADLFHSLSRHSIALTRSVVRSGISFYRNGLEKKVAAVAVWTLKSLANCYIAARNGIRFIKRKFTSGEAAPEDGMKRVRVLQASGSVTLSDGTIYNGPMEITINGQGKFTYPGKGSYEGAICHNQPEGWGVFTYSDGARYEGYLKGGKPDGAGEMHYANGAKAIGIFKEGFLHDKKGKIIYSDNDSYEGAVEKGLPHGSGKRKFENGNVYIGRFRNGLLEGQGLMRYSNGYTYKGAFKKDKQQGHGKLIYPKSSKEKSYTGNFIEGTPHGHGTIIYSDGSTTYIGQVKKGLPDGLGKLEFRIGKVVEKVVEGDFVQGILDGQGTITSSQNVIYRGKVKDHMANGRGTVIYSDRTIKGKFLANQPIGEVEISYTSDGRIYHGEIQDGEPNGRGKMTWLNTTEHEGIFKEGKLNDENGTIVYSNGSKFVGRVKDGVPDGRGTLKTGAKTYQGAFDKGKITGQGVIIFENGTRHAGSFIDGKLDGPGMIVVNGKQMAVNFEQGRLKTEASGEQDSGIEFKENEQTLFMMEF